MGGKRKRVSLPIVEGHAAPAIATLLVVIALPEERGYFHGILEKRQGWKVGSPRQRYDASYASKHGNVRVIVQTLRDMGLVEAALGTTSALTAVKPDLAMMIGLAGSMNPEEVGLGDVVVSNQAKFFGSDKVASLKNSDGTASEYLLGDIADLATKPPGAIVVDRRDKILQESFLRYQRQIVESSPCDAIISGVESAIRTCSLVELNREKLPEKAGDLKSSQRQRILHFGWVLGSHHVVDSAEYRHYLNDKNDNQLLDVHRQKGEPERAPWRPGQLLAVDMESYALLRAVESAARLPAFLGGCENLIGGLTVRGISDLCEDKGFLDRDTSNDVRRIAVANATEVGLTLIESLDWEQMLRV
jgi:nucleoside phosphorylase